MGAVDVIIDPFTRSAYCGACGAVAVDLEHARECCVVEPVPAVWRVLLAAGLVFVAVLFMVALPFVYRP